MYILFVLNSLTLLTLLILLCIPAHKILYLKDISLFAAGIIFVTSLLLLKTPLTSGISSEVESLYIVSFPSIKVSYSIILDNLSIVFLILTTFLTIIVVMTSRNIIYRIKEKYLLLFLTEFLLINTFITGEILLFYIFFEILLIPVFLIIGIWGSQKNKIFAANQFFLYTIFGSFFMLTGIIALYLFIGSTNIFVIKGLLIHPTLEKILFLMFFISFMVKIPSMPLHLWLPQAHVEAPTTGSILLAGILLKLGSYGFIRFLLYLFPNASIYYLPLILSIALISVILSSFTVLRQLDLKRIVAYSSIAHMNFIVSAIFVQSSVALTGSLLLQIAHGLSSSAMFFIVGILYDRFKSRNILYYGGLSTILPFLCFFFFIFSLANLGFPLTVNFVSELMIFLGLFEATPSIAILSLVGIFLSAVYSFTVVTRVNYGPASIYIRSYYDLTRREFYILAPIALLVLLLGVYPTPLTSYWTVYTALWCI